jgi:hypothetical protein
MRPSALTDEPFGGQRGQRTRDRRLAVTTVHEPQARAASGRTLTVRPRHIVVAVRDYPHDQATIDWAMTHATPSVDVTHLVHAYRPVRLEGCYWEPVVRARDSRYWDARGVVTLAQQRIAADGVALRAGGSAIAGTPVDVLTEISEVADLVVIGDDSNDSETSRRITWRIQDTAQCPVVCVPFTYHSTSHRGPVMVVADEYGLADAALTFGAETALRRGVSLEVSRAWSSLHEGAKPSPGWLAEQQRELNTQLASWARQYPPLPVAARIELDDSWLDRLRDASAMLVAPARSAPLLRTRPIDPAHPCPVAIVPDS